jgi:hypothetical protein
MEFWVEGWDKGDCRKCGAMYGNTPEHRCPTNKPDAPAAPPARVGFGHSGPCQPDCTCDAAIALRPPAQRGEECGCQCSYIGGPQHTGLVLHEPRDLHARLASLQSENAALRDQLDMWVQECGERRGKLDAAERSAREAEERAEQLERLAGAIALVLRDHAAGKQTGHYASRALAQIRRLLLADVLRDQDARARVIAEQGGEK